ncbi:hypothetical protein [Aestuariirhabdus sp. LZHN29]|uniref:hypothetical protein n=1 Tax=Aestuariirhabdus sp. LZHN29 TaxID=3417462 RepID=UPI003CF364CB
MFGSDTHGLDHDNSVYQFDIENRRWIQHYPPSAVSSYRISEAGVHIAGNAGTLRPWAMHSYDNIVFDPVRRALVVTSFPEHNPVRKKMSNKGEWATWIYDVENRNWKILGQHAKQPKAFAGASAYDLSAESVMLYKWRMWKLPSRAEAWVKSGPGSKHEIHYVMEYDSINQLFAVFGDHRNSNRVHLYYPSTDDAPARWEIMQPSGDAVPEDQHFPVAFSSLDGVFLLSPDDTAFVKQPSGYRKPIKPKRAFTFVYDVKSNRYSKLPNGNLPPLGMNYSMVYSKKRDSFFLLTGTTTIKVWQLKLDLKRLGINKSRSEKGSP